MSNSLAIAAVTSTLRNLIFQGVNTDVPGADVTTRPLDRARQNGTGNQVNLFLYHTTIDGAWRNQDMPTLVKPGETGLPPLPLNLYYLITAYGENDDDTVGHRLLGRAMSVMHDHPVLGADEIRTALPNNDLYQQPERVRISAQPISLEEISKLWTAFQTQYRISAAYEVSVVLIESTRPTRTPLPVLTQGEGDRGPVAQGSVIPPFPTFYSIGFPNHQLSALPGDELVLTGHHLNGAGISIQFSHPRLTAPIVANPLPQPPPDATSFHVRVPVDPAQILAGYYALSAVIARNSQPDRYTNDLQLPVAPRITTPLPAEFALDANGAGTITLTCSPRVTPEQRAFLLLGELQYAARPRQGDTNSLDFRVANVPRGEYLVRLRVDGVDSPLIDSRGPILAFDANQRITIV